MSLTDYVSTTRTGLGDTAGVRLLDDSEALRGAVPEEAGTEADGRSVVVGHAPLGDEVAVLGRLADAIGDAGIGVLVLVAEPSALPVGPLLAAATEHGLRVVRAQGVAHRRARTVLSVTRDAEVPVTAYLSQTPVATDDRAALRLANEWVGEGVALRAAVDQLTERLRGSDEEARLLRVRLDEVQSQAKAEREALQQELAGARKTAREATAKAAQGPTVKVRRAVAVLREDPVAGSRRLARAAARRVRG
jgi:hypothetical protein